MEKYLAESAAHKPTVGQEHFSSPDPKPSHAFFRQHLTNKGGAVLNNNHSSESS